MPTFLNDLRYGARTLVSRPGFALTAVLMLALGIGANATIFSWIDGFILRPITGAVHADRLVSVHGTTLTRRDISVSYPNFADMRERMPESLEGMTAIRLVALNVRTDGDPERAWGELVTSDFFSVLGVAPVHGRLFGPEDGRAPGASPVVVLSHAYWLRRFDGDLSALGRVLAVNGQPFTIVGVAPPDFDGAMPAMAVDLWVPMMMQQAIVPGDRLTARGNAWLTVLARLAPGADVPRVQVELSAVAAELEAEYPEVNEDRGVAVYPLWRDPQSAAGDLGPVLGLLLAVTAVLLLIVCANLASLLLARGTGRAREVAVRLALGATRGRIVRQLLTESLLLAIAGGAAGVVVAYWGSQLIWLFVPPSPLPIDASVSPGRTMLVLSLTLAVMTTVLFGLLPALQTTRPALVPSLKEVRGVVGGRWWVRSTLVVAQVALSVVLLVGAGLFVRTFENTRTADVGFGIEHGLIASIDLQAGGYDEARGVRLFRDLLGNAQALPGVASAALARDVPLKLGSGSDTSVTVEGYEPAPGEEITIYYDRITPDFFETMEIPVVAGRPFTDADDDDGPLTVVINETMARRYWPDGDAVGGRVDLGDWATVVGVVADVTYTTVGAPPVSYMYLPLYTFYRPDMTLIVRTDTADPGATLGSIRAAVRTLDPDLPVFDVRTMAEHKQAATFLTRLAAMLLGAFGSMALLLAGVGLYGLLAFVVGQRTQEIGVRVALGAGAGDIRRLVVWHGLRLTAVGAAAGLALAVLLFPLASSQLVGVSATDGVTYAVATLVLLAGGVAASYVPARRAARVDPIQALRYQ
jgi:macrolide transport system ATP-binding/permease protein